MGETVVNVIYSRNRYSTRPLDSITHEGAWSGKRPRIANIRVFGCLCNGPYAMVPNERNDKCDAKGKGMKKLVLGCCEGTKAYRIIRLQHKHIIINRYMLFIEDSTSVGYDFDMRQGGRNENPMVVVVNKFPTSLSCNDGEEREEQVKIT